MVFIFFPSLLALNLILFREWKNFLPIIYNSGRCYCFLSYKRSCSHDGTCYHQDLDPKIMLPRWYLLPSRSRDLGPSWMVLTHGNVLFDILEPSAFQKYSICMLGLSSIFLFNLFLNVFCNSTKTSANSSACIVLQHNVSRCICWYWRIYRLHNIAIIESSLNSEQVHWHRESKTFPSLAKYL